MTKNSAVTQLISLSNWKGLNLNLSLSDLEPMCELSDKISEKLNCTPITIGDSFLHVKNVNQMPNYWMRNIPLDDVKGLNSIEHKELLKVSYFQELKV